MFISNFDQFLFFRPGKNYYPQVILEECKYFTKEKKISKYINNTEISFNSDKGNSDAEILIKKILMKKMSMKRILMKKINKYFL